MGRKVREPEYSDWIQHLDKAGGAFQWVIRPKDFPLNTSVHARPIVRPGEQIKEDVLRSGRLQELMQSEAVARGLKLEQVKAEARDIIDTMAHDFDLRAVRVIGFALAKVIERIFDGIFVNFDKLRKIRELAKSDSVVFMPSHKSYMDFILLSLLCFDQDVPLPAIAAGMDFMNSKFMGEALRRCGAFFIRRSFGTDKLYWAIFTEYVQSHLVNSDRPVEFFVEGTRSRVGKSLFPKYGLMNVMLEPYLRGNVYDLVIVPVAINYDKILEEILYGYELLGFPKPKESTSGLFKATRILRERFGRCYVTFCEPISVRKHFGLSLHRAAFVCQPDSQFVLSEREKREIRRLGHIIVKEHNDNSVISVWPYACHTILQSLANSETLSFGQLLKSVKAQIGAMEQLGILVQVEKSIPEDLRYYMKLHSDLFHPFDEKAEDYDLKLLHHPIDKKSALDQKLLEQAVGQVVLSSYANKMMHEVADVSLICLILISTTQHQQSVVFSNFVYLQRVLAREFIVIPGDELASFARALDKLTTSKIAEVFDHTVRILSNETVLYLARLTKPSIAQFGVVLETLLRHGERHVTQTEIVAATQMSIAASFSAGSKALQLASLSTDPIKNAFATLTDYGVLIKKAKNFEVNYIKLEVVMQELTKYITLVPLHSYKL